MNCKKMFINAWVGIILSCLVALMGHLTFTVYEKLNPEGTIAITEKIKLDQMDFPAVFKICILPSFNKTNLKKLDTTAHLAIFMD